MKTQSGIQNVLAVLVFLVGMSVLLAATVVLSQVEEETVQTIWPADTLAVTSEPSDSIEAIISEKYLTIRYIFEYSCFDCHSTFTNYPWYYKIPGIKGMIDEDIKKGMEHLDLTNDYPFGGDDDQAHILEEIKEEIEEDAMPLFSYRLTHWGRFIEGTRRDSVFEWINASMVLLKQAEGAGK